MTKGATWIAGLIAVTIATSLFVAATFLAVESMRELQDHHVDMVERVQEMRKTTENWAFWGAGPPGEIKDDEQDHR